MTITTLKGRTLQTGQRVFVYYNLHKKCFSVKDLKTGLVVAHTDKIRLYNAEFRVGKAGRERVLREQKKNVHAGVVGSYHPSDIIINEYTTKKASYNPYKYDYFFNTETLEPVKEAFSVQLMGKAIYYR